MRSVISQLAARGVLVVASAGNEGGPVGSPANCAGVAAVTGLRHAGTKVGFASLGPQVAVSAPGGNCVNTSGGPCLFSIDTTYNTGTQAPGSHGYTNQTNVNVGTSFSAPIVAGIAGLMAGANGNLGSEQLIARLREGATTPFPVSADPAVPMCHILRVFRRSVRFAFAITALRTLMSSNGANCVFRRCSGCLRSGSASTGPPRPRWRPA